MVITGLLQFIKSDAFIDINLSELTDTVAVIDGYEWLRRSPISSLSDIYQGKHRSSLRSHRLLRSLLNRIEFESKPNVVRCNRLRFAIYMLLI